MIRQIGALILLLAAISFSRDFHIPSSMPPLVKITPASKVEECEPLRGCPGLAALPNWDTLRSLRAAARLKGEPSQEKGSSSQVMGLVELYGNSSIILYGEEDKYAAELLFAALQPNLKNVKLVPAKGQKLGKDDLVVYMGSFKSNPLAQHAFKSLGYSLRWEAMTEGSFLLKTFRKSGKTTVFVAGKDRSGTLYAVNDLINYYLRVEMGRVLLNELNMVERAHLKYRWFWNWDNRSNWNLTDSDNNFTSEVNSYSVPNKYLNSPEAYLRDVKKTIDFMSQHRLNGLILWGFLRDTHGGVAAAQELCKYADERGVRILPGIGLSGHGGFFYEGDNKFNLATWIRAHPELRSVDLNGDFRDHTLCPEKPQNRNWYREGLKWLYENFKIGGLNLELSDFFVCYCQDCKKARQLMRGNDPDYYKDMARVITFLAQEVHKLDPNTWICYSTHTGFDFESIQNPPYWARASLKVTAPFPPEFTRLVPDFAICQWSLSQMVENHVWPSPFKAPALHNVGRLQWGNASSKTAKQLFLKRIQEVTQHVISSNLEGLVIYGEESSDHPNVELNYMAFSEFAFNPAADPENFFRYKVSRLYGGVEAAKRLMKILDLLENEQGMTLQNLEEVLRLAKEAQDVSDRDGKARWAQFIQYLESLKDA